MYKAKGSIKSVLAPETFQKKDGTTGSKSKIIITTEAKYNPDICFDIMNSEVRENLSMLNVGDEVEVDFNLSSREYNGRYYHNVIAWKITKQEVLMHEVGSDNDPF